MSVIQLTEELVYENGSFKRFDSETKKDVVVKVMPLIDCPLVTMPEVRLALIATVEEEKLQTLDPYIKVDAVWLKEEDEIFLKKIKESGNEHGFGNPSIKDFKYHPLMTALLCGHPMIEELFLEANALARDDESGFFNYSQTKSKCGEISGLAKIRAHDWLVFDNRTMLNTKKALRNALQNWVWNAAENHYVSQVDFQSKLTYQIQYIHNNNALVTIADPSSGNHYLLFVFDVKDAEEIENALMEFDSERYGKAFYFQRGIGSVHVGLNNSINSCLKEALTKCFEEMRGNAEKQILVLDECHDSLWFESKFCNVPSLKLKEVIHDETSMDELVDE